MKWRDCGKLLGFVDKINILKIYDISRKKFIFYLENIEKIKDFGFFGDDFILIINSDKNKIYKYKYNINKKGGLKITKKLIIWIFSTLILIIFYALIIILFSI